MPDGENDEATSGSGRAIPREPTTLTTKLRASPRVFWRIVIRTGTEGPTESNPTYLNWIVGFPLVFWGSAVVAFLLAAYYRVLGLFPAILALAALANMVATARILLVQVKSLSELNRRLESPDGGPPPIKSGHEIWRARTAAWGYEAVLAGLLFLALIRGLPTWALSDLFPPALLTLYEFTLLGLTVSIIAILSQYTSRTASVDARALSSELRAYTNTVSSSAREASQRISDDISVFTGRIIEATTASAKETNTALTSLAGAVRELASSASAQNELIKSALEKTEAAAAAARHAIAEHTASAQAAESARKEEQLEEILRLRPKLSLRFGVEGMILHRIRLDLYDEGSPARGVTAEVSSSRNVFQLAFGDLPSRVVRSIDIGDIKSFDLSDTLRIKVRFLDLGGRPYVASAELEFSRSEGFLGRTTGWLFVPSNWVALVASEDLPG